MQQKESQWHPVAYASRSMSKTEQRYVQIEKEALAATWACEKFSTYIIGMKFLIEMDHKPLVPLLGEKHLDSLGPIASTIPSLMCQGNCYTLQTPYQDLHHTVLLQTADYRMK